MFDQNNGKLLLIKPPFSAWPVGFAYVLACLEANSIPFDFIDASRSHNWKREMKHTLNNDSYFAVATGGLIGFFRFFQEVSHIKQKCRPDIPVILGANITKDASNSLLFDRLGMNFGILGEAETSLPALINKIINGDNDIGDMPGIVYKNTRGDVIRNLPKRLDLKSDNIRPAWHNFDVDYYIKTSSIPCIGNDLKVMPILSGRGCVGKCTFCSPTIGGFRKRPIEHVIDEIEDITSKYNFDSLIFMNEMFYPTAKEIRDFCDQYRLLKNKKPWIAQVRVDSNIDVITFGQMKDAGCFAVNAGVESGSDRILSLMNKKTTSQQIRTFFTNARMANMPTNGTFIVGSESETEEDIKKTIDLVIDEEINTDASLMYVYPGTAVYDKALKKGLIKDEMEHLKKATQGGLGPPNLFAPDAKESFLNISAIPDNQFFDIATREVRRYYTSVFNRYPVQDLSCRIESQGKEALMAMAGKCNECGSDVRYEYNIFRGLEYVGLLGIGIADRLVCPECYKQLSFNIYTCKEMKDLRDHFSLLKEKISKRNKIIICGINGDAMFMLKINLFDLDYGKIKGFVDFTKQHRNKYYVNYPVFGADDVVDLNPDCILVVDSASDNENIIRRIYSKKQMPPPEFLYLYDKELLITLKEAKSRLDSGYNKFLFRFGDKFKNKYKDLINYCDRKDIYVPEFLTEFVKYSWNKFYLNKR
jgi:anaerobic magnesium-protoporphyrin IX monomethyl ester cyclase